MIKVFQKNIFTNLKFMHKERIKILTREYDIVRISSFAVEKER